MPDRGRSSKYEDKFFTTGLGYISFSAAWHDLSPVIHNLREAAGGEVKRTVSLLAQIIRSRAPKKTGALRQGIIDNPDPEKSSNPNKIVHDIVFDAEMNDTFVKMSKAGIRYYYPASQHYGFKVGANRRVPGKYFMRTPAVDHYGEYTRRMADCLNEVLEKI